MAGVAESRRKRISFRVQFRSYPFRGVLRSPMKLLVRLIAFALFIVFFGFALKNTDEVVLHLFWSSQARSPLILLLLGFLVAGTVMGVLGMTGTVLRHRRDLSRCRKELEQLKADAASQAVARTQPPTPDTLIEQIGL